MPLEDVLVHVATPVRMKAALTAAEDWIEGEFAEEPDATGTPFACCLFLPQGTESSGSGRTRKVTEPLLLYGDLDQDGDPVALKADDELLIVAPELNVAQGLAADASVRWMVNGAPQLFGRPGDEPLGGQITVRRIED